MYSRLSTSWRRMSLYWLDFNTLIAIGYLISRLILLERQVVSRETVRIALTIAALNNLGIMAANIGNAYLNAPCREK
eukprot:14408273-Ditylum_brightwellii.AAC.1